MTKKPINNGSKLLIIIAILKLKKCICFEIAMKQIEADTIELDPAIDLFEEQRAKK